MKYLLTVMALFDLASYSHHTQAPSRGPSSDREELISEDNGSKIVRSGDCDVMLSDGQARKLFALIDHVQPQDMSVQIF